ncbi:thiol reductant ABC exporter subunit CydD [Burkholderia sp. L27(2015)]|uniref:thiol reductant ABC exporter subunit CydD n=1 Tax=Burkholderia sp. L27(2015) TaxID=1641858 RepID=UPI00131E88BF|nr:thiol reductant ABC exporter subunit CydD [Burkholderia sp. L27(2015)]
MKPTRLNAALAPRTAHDSQAPRAATKKSTESWLQGLRASVRPTLALAVGYGLVGGVLVIVQAALLAWVVNAAMLNHARLEQVWPALAVLLAVFALRFGAVRATENAAFAAGASVRTELHARLLRHIHALGPSWVQWQPRGALANDLVTGIDALEGYYTRWLPNRALTTLLPIAILAVVLPNDWLSALILLVTAPLIPLFMILLGKGAEDLNQQQWRQLTRLSARFLDTLQGLTTLKLFNASRREAQVVASISEAYRESTMKVLRVAFLSAVVLEFLATVSIAMVAVLVGFHLLYGKISFQHGFFVLLIVPEFYLPLRTLGAHYHARMEAIGAAERIMAVLAIPVTSSEVTATVAMGTCAPLTCRADDPPTLSFGSVCSAYTPGYPILRDVSFTAPRGGITALVGPSGAGKSTVLRLLLGFATQDTGSIRVDGRLLATYSSHDWLTQVAWVPQRGHVFAGSVLENLRMAKPDATHAEIRRAAEQAGAHEFISALPHGYDTPLGERGAGLSGGEIQRLTLARALLKNARVLLLDEPTAHLDAHSRTIVHRTLRHLAQHHTVLLVAHRLETAQLAQHIVVLEAGRVVQSGTHQQLLAAPGLYARMAAGAHIERTDETEAIV